MSRVMARSRAGSSTKSAARGTKKGGGGGAGAEGGDLASLRAEVRLLQKESTDQLSLEYESQQTFEHLKGQVTALRTAFGSLSELMTDEVEGLRADTAARAAEADAVAGRGSRADAALREELALVRRQLEESHRRERGWAKDVEVLKASHAHSVQWMQQLQRDSADLREQLAASRTEAAERAAAAAEEAARAADAQHERAAALESAAARAAAVGEQQAAELREAAAQRNDDLALIEAALSATQAQQLQARAASEEGFGAQGADLNALRSKSDALASGAMAQKVQQAAQKEEVDARFENVSRVLGHIAEALQIAPPQLQPAQPPPPPPPHSGRAPTAAAAWGGAMLGGVTPQRATPGAAVPASVASSFYASPRR